MINKKEKSIDGVVINVSPYKDNSAIVSLITIKGLFSIYVNNSYKIKNFLKPLLIPFNYLSVEYVESEEKFIIAKYCEVIKEYSSLLNSYKNSLFFQCLIQTISFLYNYNESFNLSLFLLILNSVENKKDLLSLLLLFIGNIYSDLGIKQNSNSCVFCKSKSNIVSFSLNDGGFVCANCITKNHRLNKKDDLDLFVFRYIFNDQINEKLLNKKVPVESGVKLLKQLSTYLEEYFDIQKLSSIDIFINYLINGK